MISDLDAERTDVFSVPDPLGVAVLEGSDDRHDANADRYYRQALGDRGPAARRGSPDVIEDHVVSARRAGADERGV
jgi:hypothetical protein